MKAWRGAVTMAAVLAAGSAGAATDNARPRGGGDSSSAGSRHHSGGGASSSSSGGSSNSSSSSSSSSSDDRRPPTGAQLRHPRAGTGTGHFHHGGGYYPYYGGYPYYGYYDPFYAGFYGYGWYSPFYWGYGAPGYAYGGGPSYSSHRYGASYRAGQVRVQVQPSQTRVYVDGYYAGVADDFDGLFQRLNVAAGGHDLSLRLDGYQTFNVKLYVPMDDTIKLQHKMQKGAGEVNAGVIGQPVDYSRFEEREAAEAREDEGRADYGDDRDRRADQVGERALVRLDVLPADASVYVDGVFRGTGRDLRQLRLPAGRHRIEVVRPGYRTIERDVELAPGQTLDVGIDLDRG
jgi:hypothetical protein